MDPTVPTSSIDARSPNRPSSSGRAPFPRKAAAALVVALILTSLALSYELGAQSGGSSRPTNLPASIVDYVNITVRINATTGAPQFVPANFTVRAGLVAITIVDEDFPVAFPGCSCNVTGTVGNVEWLNGTAHPALPDSNVAHTFSVQGLGLNVLSPGNSTVFFEAVFSAGTYLWMCMAPCGSNGFTGFPMGTPGYMQGTITVT